jgi:hypothetical protein
VPLGSVPVGATFNTTNDIADAVEAVTVTYATGVFEDVSRCEPPVSDRCASCKAGMVLGLLALWLAATVPVPVTLTVPTPSPVVCDIVIVVELPLGSDAVPAPATDGYGAPGAPPLHATPTAKTRAAKPPRMRLDV